MGLSGADEVRRDGARQQHNRRAIAEYDAFVTTDVQNHLFLLNSPSQAQPTSQAQVDIPSNFHRRSGRVVRLQRTRFTEEFYEKILCRDIPPNHVLNRLSDATCRDSCHTTDPNGVSHPAQEHSTRMQKSRTDPERSCRARRRLKCVAVEACPHPPCAHAPRSRSSHRTARVVANKASYPPCG